MICGLYIYTSLVYFDRVSVPFPFTFSVLCLTLTPGGGPGGGHVNMVLNVHRNHKAY